MTTAKFVLENFDNKKVNILGSEWIIKVVDLIDGGIDAAGSCDGTVRVIKIRKIIEHSDFENLSVWYKQTIRHEIIHAFLQESGLDNCSHATTAWATNEEMVDWIAAQGPKLFKVWKELNI